MREGIKLALVILALLFGAAGSATAQNVDQDRTVAIERDDGMNMGWIGILGLVGLAGLMRRDKAVRTPVSRTA